MCVVGKKKTAFLSGVEAEYFVPNCQYLIFKPQYSIFRLPYLSYFHYLNNYEGANGGTQFSVNC